MLDISGVAAAAASQFGASLKDDPTAFPAGHDTPAQDVMAACRAEALSSARSAVARRVGAGFDKLAEAIEKAIGEDGLLADIDAIVDGFFPGLRGVDTDKLAVAATWGERVDVLKSELTAAVARVEVPAVTVTEVLTYLNSDPRFDGAGRLKKAVAALPDAPEGDSSAPNYDTADSEWDDAPAAAVLTRTQADHVNSASKYDTASNEWDDAPAQPAKGRGRKPPPAAPVSGFPQLLVAAGLTKTEIADLAGVSVSYVSYIFTGRRPWPGLVEDQVARMIEELSGRRAAIDDALAALASGKLTSPDGLGRPA